jgi:predicted nucleic acid-binding protein
VRFVDTNLLLYAISVHPDEATKAARARAILDDRALATSVQVLQEFYVQSTRPTRPDRLSHDQASALIESWLRFPVQENTVDLLKAAAAAAQRHRISYWDAAVVEAARAMGCLVVLSEDLSDGQDFDGVQVENPFRGL